MGARVRERVSGAGSGFGIEKEGPALRGEGREVEAAVRERETRGGSRFGREKEGSALLGSSGSAEREQGGSGFGREKEGPRFGDRLG